MDVKNDVDLWCYAPQLDEFLDGTYDINSESLHDGNSDRRSEISSDESSIRQKGI